MPNMTFSLSTHWNAAYHDTGEAIVDDILALGVDRLELGYDLRIDQVAGVRRRVEQGAVTVVSVHNYCPTPVGAPYGHPELFLMSARDQRTRDSAVLHTSHTIQFAAELGANVVVIHAGRIAMRHITTKLLRLVADDKQFSPRYEKLRTRLLLKREKLAPAALDRVKSCLAQLLPHLEKHKVRLAIENLPSWETVPNESELYALLDDFDSPYLATWHDIGHGRLREMLGVASAPLWLTKYGDRLAGIHIHDVSATGVDHIMPPQGTVDFTTFKPFIRNDMVLAFESAPGTPPAEILTGIQSVAQAWGIPT